MLRNFNEHLMLEKQNDGGFTATLVRQIAAKILRQTFFILRKKSRTRKYWLAWTSESEYRDLDLRVRAVINWPSSSTPARRDF